MEQAAAEQGEVKELSDMSADLRRLKQAAKLVDRLSGESKQWLLHRLQRELATASCASGKA